MERTDKIRKDGDVNADDTDANDDIELKRRQPIFYVKPYNVLTIICIC